MYFSIQMSNPCNFFYYSQRKQKLRTSRSFYQQYFCLHIVRSLLYLKILCLKTLKGNSKSRNCEVPSFTHFLFVERDKRKISTYSRNLLDSNGNFASQNNLFAKRFSGAVELVLSYALQCLRGYMEGIVYMYNIHNIMTA